MEDHRSDPFVKTWLILKDSLMVLVVLPLVFAFSIAFLQSAIGEEGINAIFGPYPWLRTWVNYAPVLLITLFWMWCGRDSLKHHGLTIKKDMLKTSFIIGGIAAVYIFIVDMAFDVFSRYGVFSDINGPINLIGAILSLGLISVITEEIIFRGLMQTDLLDSFKAEVPIGPWRVHISVFIIVVYEVLFHLLTDWNFGISPSEIAPQLIYVIPFAFLSSYVFQRTRSLVGPFIIHSMGNVGELILFLIFLR